jgi:hypothetical protein
LIVNSSSVVLLLWLVVVAVSSVLADMLDGAVKAGEFLVSAVDFVSVVGVISISDVLFVSITIVSVVDMAKVEGKRAWKCQ